MSFILSYPFKTFPLPNQEPSKKRLGARPIIRVQSEKKKPSILIRKRKEKEGTAPRAAPVDHGFNNLFICVDDIL